MDIGFSLKDAVEKRYSVRTYDNRPLDAGTKQNLLSYADALQNPLGPKIRVQFIERETAANGEKLGTYGIIKGTGCFLGVTVPDDEQALEALGYDFEQLVLYATSLGLGTCWLGGTFNRSAFTAAMEIKENELFPILSPIGWPAGKKSLTEKIMRRYVKADARLSWDKLFFKDDFSTPLSKEESGDYAFPLEMLRLAPSAVNGQPWRVLIKDDAVYFFKKGSAVREAMSVDMQQIDLGIAICHFDLAVQEMGISGRFDREAPDFDVPEELSFVARWIKE